MSDELADDPPSEFAEALARLQRTIGADLGAEIEQALAPLEQPHRCRSQSGHNWGAPFDGHMRCCVCGRVEPASG